MDAHQALNHLRVKVFKDIEDIERQYLAEKKKNALGSERAANDRMKAVYNKRLTEIEEAWEFVQNNPKKLKKTATSTEMPKLGRKGKIGLVLALVVVMALGGIYAINTYKANQRAEEAALLVEQAMNLYRKSKLESDAAAMASAEKLFEQAMELGSPTGRFYVGQIAFKKGERNEGITLMEEAIEQGFNDPVQIRLFQQLNQAIISK